MQAVRGYFDGVFAGTYPKAIPADKRAAIESDADAKYTANTGRPNVSRPDATTITFHTFLQIAYTFSLANTI
jgi:hypothetical protein